MSVSVSQGQQREKLSRSHVAHRVFRRLQLAESLPVEQVQQQQQLLQFTFPPSFFRISLFFSPPVNLANWHMDISNFSMSASEKGKRLRPTAGRRLKLCEAVGRGAREKGRDREREREEEGVRLTIWSQVKLLRFLLAI